MSIQVMLVLIAVAITLVAPRWSLPRLFGSLGWGVLVVMLWWPGWL